MTNAREIASGFGRRNAVINGKFDISQRGLSVAGINASVYTADRFVFFINRGVWTYNRLTDAPAGTDFTNCAELLVTTADAVVGAADTGAFVQRVEGFNFRPLYLRPFTISFWVKSNVTGQYYFAFDNGIDRSYASPYTISVANAWEYKTITVHELPVGGTWNFSNGIGAQLQWSLGQGTNFQTATFNTWITNQNGDCGFDQVNVAATIGNYWRITGVQLEVGGVATEFEYRTFGEELELCQRYYEKTYNLTAPPGTFPSSGLSETSSGTTLGAVDVSWVFHTKKRAVPTVVTYNPTTGAIGTFHRFDFASIASDVGLQQETSVRIITNAVTSDSSFHSIAATADAEL